jgi:hypothetical protein
VRGIQSELRLLRKGECRREAEGYYRIRTKTKTCRFAPAGDIPSLLQLRPPQPT